MLPFKRALQLAARLDLDVERTDICQACLSFVSHTVERGYEPAIRGATVEWTPILWDEGLEAPLRVALESARSRGVPDAERALADVRERGPRTTIARAAVRRLAYQQTVRARAMFN